MQQARDFVTENIEHSVAGAPVWTLSTYGNFTISSAYDALRPRGGHSLSSTCIWGGGLPSKISIFMWKLLRRLLPYPDVLQSFEISLPSVCPICWKASASLDHCLLTCESIHGVWFYFGDIFGLPRSIASTVRSQCHSWWLLTPAGSAMQVYAQMFPCLILWFLWRAYNECLYEGVPFSQVAAVAKIRRESFLISLSRPPRSRGQNGYALVSAGLVAGFVAPPRRVTVWVKWLEPPVGRLKLNTDAVFTEAGAAGGACIRGSRGELLVALCFRLEASSAMEAETISLKQAIQWCSSVGRIPYTVEVDSLALATLVSSHEAMVPWKLKAAISYIRSALALWVRILDIFTGKLIM